MKLIKQVWSLTRNILKKLIWTGAIGTFFGLLFLVVWLSALLLKNYQDKRLGVEGKRLETNVSPTEPAPLPSRAIGVKTLMLDDLVDCMGPDYKTFKSTKEKCYEFQKSWKFTPPDFSKITPLPTNATKTVTTTGTNTQPTYQATTYFRCTIYYTNLNRYETYDQLFKSKDECDSYQSAVNMSTNVTPPPATVYVPTYTVEQCKSDVTAKYATRIQNCNNYSGSSREACLEININQRHDEYLNCN